ncbi:MAG: hypothetical protein GY853_12005 [PVC group bacterium]|nr:hypothetical protein [PVC group bacterium]
MKRWNSISLLLIVLLLINGCDNNPFARERYQVIKGVDGALYRLDKKTGEIKIVKVSNYIEEEPEIDPSLNGAEIEDTELEIPKDWGEHQVRGKNLRIKLITYWKLGKLHYEFEVYPFSSLKRMFQRKENDAYYRLRKHGFLLKLVDENNFVISEIFVNLNDMKKVPDLKGKTNSLFLKSSLELGMREYRQIENYNFDTNLDWIVIPNYKFPDKVKDLIQTYNCYGEVDPKVDKDAPVGSKYWWITYPERNKVYFSSEEELLRSYEKTILNILETNK